MIPNRSRFCCTDFEPMPTNRRYWYRIYPDEPYRSRTDPNELYRPRIDSGEQKKKTILNLFRRTRTESLWKIVERGFTEGSYSPGKIKSTVKITLQILFFHSPLYQRFRGWFECVPTDNVDVLNINKFGFHILKNKILLWFVLKTLQPYFTLWLQIVQSFWGVVIYNSKTMEKSNKNDKNGTIKISECFLFLKLLLKDIFLQVVII